MRSFAALCLPAVLAFGFVGVSLTPTTAAAQTADAPIEQRMSADEFKAAGLDKLSAAELANLKVVWMPKQVLFADGSKLGGEE